MLIWLAAMTEVCLGTANPSTNADLFFKYELGTLLKETSIAQEYYACLEDNRTLPLRSKQEQTSIETSNVSNDATYYYNIGKTFRDAGEYTAAIDAFAKSVQLDQDFAWAQYNYGFLLSKEGEYSKAIEPLNKAITLFSNALSSDTLASQDKPALVNAYFHLGKTYFKLAQEKEDPIWHVDAREAFLDAIAAHERIQAQEVIQNQDTSEPPRSQNAFTLQEPSIDETIGWSNEDVGAFADSHYMLGLLYTKSEDYDVAQYFFLRSIGLSNNLYFRAKAYQALGDLAQVHEKNPTLAVAYYELAITIRDDLATAHHKLGIALTAIVIDKSEEDVQQDKSEEDIQQYYFDAANRAFHRAIQLYEEDESTNSDENLSQTYMGLGNLYFKRELYGEAVQQYKNAFFLKKNDDFSEAKEALDKARRAHFGQDAKWVEEDFARYRSGANSKKRISNYELFRSVVRVISCCSSNNNEYEGTGFVIYKEGNKLWILTNRHVIAGEDNARISSESFEVEVEFYTDPESPERTRLRLPATVSFPANDNLDVAFVIVESGPTDIDALKLVTDTSDILLGDELSVIGHPNTSPAEGWSIDKPKFSNFVKNDLLQLSGATTSIGSSGGPVMYEYYNEEFNVEELKVVGILSRVTTEISTISSAGSFSLAYRVEYFLDALYDIGIFARD